MNSNCATEIWKQHCQSKNASNLFHTKGAFVWDQSGIRIFGIMRVSVCLGAILIPEYLDFHSGYSTRGSRIAGIYSGIYSGLNSYSGISQTNAPLAGEIWKRNNRGTSIWICVWGKLGAGKHLIIVMWSFPKSSFLIMFRSTLNVWVSVFKFPRFQKRFWTVPYS